jgi:peroxiredoxin
MKGMPDIQFPVSTTNALAQQFFTQGVGQLHGFWYFEAERSFRQAVVHDPNLAMAYWGMTMANIKNGKRAGDFIRKAVELRDQAGPRERLWIDALAEYYREPERDEKTRRRDYLRALEHIVYQYPDDVEAKAFLAFHIWESSYNGWPISSSQAVESVLKEVFAVQPLHPAHHYRIHLWDGDKDTNAIRALPSAARCGQSGPGIAHLWHMSGHTFNKLRRYDDMAWQQEASVRVDNAQLMRDGILPDEIHNYAHNSEWLVQTLNYVGRVRDALRLAQNMIEMPRHPKFNAVNLTTNGTPYQADSYDTANQGRRRLIETLLRYELWEDAIALADSFYLEPTELGMEQAQRARLLGIAHFSLGRMDEGQAQIEALGAAAKVLRVERAAVMDAAEAKAREDKKSEEDARKAMKDVLDRYAQPLKTLDQWTAELKVWAALPDGTLDGLTNEVAELKSVSKERLSQVWLQLGATNLAETLAKEAVEAGTNQVQLLANQADILWRLGKTNEAQEVFGTLRERSATLDLEMPVFRRLTPLATSLGLAADWRVPATPRNDAGERPDLASLGPFLWSPVAARPFTLTTAEGRSIALQNYRGRPVQLVFYLGHGCLHCLDQLNALAPVAGAFQSAGIDILAISADSPEALQKTQAQARAGGGFPFPLVADPAREVFRQYRVYDGFEDLPLHGVFLVDGAGLVRWRDISFEPFTDMKFLLDESKRQLQQIDDKSRLPKTLTAAVTPER